MTHQQQVACIPSLVCFLASDIHSLQMGTLNQATWEQIEAGMKQWSDPIVHPYYYVKNGAYGGVSCTNTVHVFLQSSILLLLYRSFWKV